MAAQPRRSAASAKPGGSSDLAWNKLTWGDLERLGGSPERGPRAIVSASGPGERPPDLESRGVAGDGCRRRPLYGPCHVHAGESTCTSPIELYLSRRGANGCKHAVSVVAEFLQVVAVACEIPVAADDDPRWAKFRDRAAEPDDDWDDEEADDDDSLDCDESDQELAKSPLHARKSARKPARTAPVNWNQKIEQEIRKKTRRSSPIWSGR